MEEVSYITNLIKDYYKSAEGIAPDRVGQREFGIGDFERKIKFRHIKFKTESELKKYLTEKAPPYISYSTAYYTDPEVRPMENKEWLGSELVFDLDATDMNLSCQVAHGKSWVCENCLKEVKQEAIKLIEDFLIPDFGFSEKEMSINFSGNRGYHIHIKRETLLRLDSNARKEISDYISGNGLEIEKLFFLKKANDPQGKETNIKVLMGPRPSDTGWKGKIARGVISKLNAGVDELTNLNIENKEAKNLYKKRLLIEMGINKGNWDYVYIKDKLNLWKKIVQDQAISQSDKIDKNVTKDPTHLIRLPDSIHGDTGLIARKISSLASLEKFEPMNDAIAFKKGEISIKADSKYAVVMNNQNFGPYKSEKITLPLYAGLYLCLKGLAAIAV